MKTDIEKRIKDNFSDVDKVKQLISDISVPAEEMDRVIRCVLYLSDSDYDSLKHWVTTANIDRREVFYFAEYDNRSERKWNFSKEFDKPTEYQYRDD